MPNALETKFNVDYEIIDNEGMEALRVGDIVRRADWVFVEGEVPAFNDDHSVAMYNVEFEDERGWDHYDYVKPHQMREL